MGVIPATQLLIVQRRRNGYIALYSSIAGLFTEGFVKRIASNVQASFQLELAVTRPFVTGFVMI